MKATMYVREEFIQGVTTAVIGSDFHLLITAISFFNLAS